MMDSCGALGKAVGGGRPSYRGRRSVIAVAVILRASMRRYGGESKH
jgi:hypothetical protein